MGFDDAARRCKYYARNAVVCGRRAGRQASVRDRARGRKPLGEGGGRGGLRDRISLASCSDSILSISNPSQGPFSTLANSAKRVFALGFDLWSNLE